MTQVDIEENENGNVVVAQSNGGVSSLQPPHEEEVEAENALRNLMEHLPSLEPNIDPQQVADESLQLDGAGIDDYK